MSVREREKGEREERGIETEGQRAVYDSERERERETEIEREIGKEKGREYLGSNGKYFGFNGTASVHFSRLICFPPCTGLYYWTKAVKEITVEVLYNIIYIILRKSLLRYCIILYYITLYFIISYHFMI